MKPPIFVRPLTDVEQEAVAAGLHSADAFTLRRCQIVRASAAGRQVPQIAHELGCDEHTGRNAIHAAFTPQTAEQLREFLLHSPREFGHPTTLWTLDLAAEEAHRQGLTDQVVPGATVRATLVRLGVRWLRAKQWITSPDPADARKKGSATACSA